MLKLLGAGKRLLVGRPLRTEHAGEHLLPKWVALPLFASDPLSSVAYASQEMLLVLALGGLAYLHLTPFLAAGVVLLLVVVVASYRQVVYAYPTGGGAFEVAARNLGRPAALTAASALMVDYVLTVAVSVAAGVDAVVSAFPSLHTHRVAIALGFVAFLTAMNLRGVKESGRAFAVPTYAFVVGILAMLAVAAVRFAVGHPPVAESAAYRIETELQGLGGLALVFLALRAFSSGCTALTGVEAIANGVPAFKHPRSENAAKTLLAMGALAVTMFTGITALALLAKVRIAEDTCALVGFPGDCRTAPQRTVVAQLAAATFGNASLGFYYIQAVTAGILILAANTAYNGFPLLGSVLAKDRDLPRQLYNRGDRLVHSNGVLLLAAAAGSLIWAFDAQVTRLIQLYIIGVFTSFTLSQLGMVRHWTRPLRAATDASDRRRFVRLRLVNGTGAALTGVVLVIVLVTKFTHGAWIVVVAMPMLYLLMQAIHRHYSSVNRELWVEPGQGLPPAGGTHAVVLVSKLHKPTLRALSYARATHPTTLVAVTVAIDDADSPDLEREWEAHRIPVELVVLRSPYREITRPVLAYVRRIRRRNPGDVVSVFLPEYVVGRWWEHLLHNQSALRLKVRLLFQPGVMVTSVPWQLASSERVARRPEPLAPGMALRADETVVPDEQISAQATAASGAAPGRDRSHGQA